MQRTFRVALYAAFVVACGVGAVVIVGQTPETVVSRDVGFFDPGVDPQTGGQPRIAVNYLAVNATCGLAKTTPPTVVINPTTARIDDPADPTKDCLLNQGGSTLPSVPIGQGYRAAVRVRTTTQISGWSALSNPFGFAAPPPPVVTGVRIQ